ncbi:MAG: HlyC/CorC family transporter [Opitutaceae bacterium]|nr:HlyC/CorC family transporter [Opitutaceae bacterium]
MNSILFEILIILLLLLANGVFAMAEIAVVSSRQARLKKLADEGSKKAAAALKLSAEPTRFLSTVQIGITLIGILAGTFGGASLSAKLAVEIAKIPALANYSLAIAIVIVVGVITYCSLIIGELVPKRMGLSNPERRAMLVAKPMMLLARTAAPFVWFLTASSNGVIKLLGLDKDKEAPPSEEEVDHLLEQGTSAGVFHSAERAMVEGVLRLDERLVTELMTRRSKIVWLNVNDTDDVNWRKIVTSGHSHFPVYDGTRDNVIGMVSVKALWANAAIGVPNQLRNHLVKPLFVPDTITAVQLLDTFRKTGKHLGLVTDEFGSIQGIVTLIDVMEAIVGALPEPGDRREPDAIQREDGAWLVDGAMNIEDLCRRFSLNNVGVQEDGRFETLGGMVMDRLGRIPMGGEHFVLEGWKFQVVDMDRHRVDKVLMQKVESTGVDIPA